MFPNVDFGKKVYIVYHDLIFTNVQGRSDMNSVQNVEEIRWLVVKAMLDDFPSLKKKVKDYVHEN